MTAPDAGAVPGGSAAASLGLPDALTAVAGARAVAIDFEEFYAGTSRAVIAQVFAMTGNWHEAQEAVAEAYARALARWSRVGRYDDPQGWVRTVAYRLCVSRWRKARRLVFGSSDAVIDGALGGAPGPMEDHVALVAALQALPTAQREALVLHYIADLPVARIAAELGVPEGTVKARLSRGRTALAHALTTTDEDHPVDGNHHV